MQATKVDLTGSLRAAEEGCWEPNPEIAAAQAKVNAGLARAVAEVDGETQVDGLTDERRRRGPAH